MDTAGILASLRAERDRIGRAIEALEALDNRGTARGATRANKSAASSPGKGIRRRKRLTPAAKKHLSLMMKKRWAERKRTGKA